MSNENYRPRITFEITEEQYLAFQSIDLPRGWQKAIFAAIVDDIIRMHATYGINALACIIGSIARPSDVLETLRTGVSYGEKFNKDEDNNG